MSEQPRSVRATTVILAALLVGSLVPRLATLRGVRLPSGQVAYDHFEGDELVYQTLIEQVHRHFPRYTLQGTPVLRKLDRRNYDHPVFMHPPLFVYTAYVLSALARLPLPLVPVAMNLLTVLFVYWIGRQWSDDEDSALGAAFLAAVCPVTWFVSQKIWLDNLLILTVTASFAVHCWAVRRRTADAYVVSGLMFGLAFLSKTTAVFLLPALGVLTWQRDRVALRGRRAAAFALPALLLGGAWLAVLRLANGPGLWLGYPHEQLQQQSPFVRMIVNRPWYFYFTSVLAFSPVYALALRRRPRRPVAGGVSVAPLWVWWAGFFVAQTLFGLLGWGYQMRYVAPAYPALALLTGAALARAPRWKLLLAVALIGYGMITAFHYAVLLTPQSADLSASMAGMLWQVIVRPRPMP